MDIKLNKRVLLSVIALGLVGATAFVMALKSLSSFGVWAPIQTETKLYFVIWTVSLLAGLCLPLGRVTSCASPEWAIVSPEGARLSVKAFSIIAAAGALILVYEFAFVRGYGFDTPAQDIRFLEVARAESSGSGSLGGAIGRVLVSAIAAAWVISALRWRQMNLAAVAVLGVSTMVVFVYQSHFEGGRIFFTALIVAALVASVGNFIEDTKSGTARSVGSIRPTHLAPIALLVALFLAMQFYNAKIFAVRGEASASRIEALIAARSAQSKAAAQALDLARRASATPYALNYIQYAANFPVDLSNISGLNRFGPRDVTKAMAWLYITQGVSQVDANLEKENLTFAYGMYQFPQLAMLLDKILKSNLRYDEAGNLSIYGAYIALPGAAYVDFGWVGGLLFSLGIGVLLRISVECLYSRTGSVVTFVGPFLVVVLIACPIVSLVPNLWPCLCWIAMMCLPSLLRKCPGFARTS